MLEIGRLLREARMRQGLDIAEVEERTRIRAKYLRALENEEWSSLPGETYVQRFLKTYSDLLGLDSDRIVDEHRRQHESVPRSEAAKSIQKRSTESAKRKRRRSLPSTAVTVIAIAIVFGLLFTIGLLGGGDDGGSDQPISSTQTTTTKKERSSSNSSKKTSSKSTKVVSLKIKPEVALWVCLIDYNGEKLIPGKTVPVSQAEKKFRSKRFLLTLGNGQAEIVVNGKTRSVPDSSEPIGYRITGNGVKELSKSERPTCS